MFLLVMKTDLHLETSGPRYGLKFFPSPPNIRSGGRRKWPFWILYLHVSHGEINAPLSHPDVKTIFRMEKYTSHKTTITVARKLIQGLIPQPAFNLPAFPPFKYILCGCSQKRVFPFCYCVQWISTVPTLSGKQMQQNKPTKGKWSHSRGEKRFVSRRERCVFG